MNKEPLISVIVPIYNVEKYLDRCVKSIVGQTFKNLEIILVDDGSPDNCPQICDEWAKKDSRIRVVHRKNGGLSCARNSGLAVATGDYITFIDSDDWIALDTYEYCINLLDKYEGADVVQFNLILAKDELVNISQEKEIIDIYQDKDILEYYMESSTRKSGGFSVCRCLFDAPTAKRYRFREGKINEDIDYKYKVLRDSHKVIVSNQIKYFYWQGDNSISSGKLKSRDFQLFEAADELYKLTQSEAYGNIAFLGCVKKARTPFSLLCRIAMWGIGDASLNEGATIRRLLKEHRRNLPILLKAPLPVSRKILAIMFCISFSLSRKVLSLLRCVIA